MNYRAGRMDQPLAFDRGAAEADVEFGRVMKVRELSSFANERGESVVASGERALFDTELFETAHQLVVKRIHFTVRRHPG
jgi:hypothetical protein